MNKATLNTPTTSDLDSTEYAALDLGSNSFHMVTARLYAGSLQITDRLQEKVQLASSLITNGHIHPEAFERGLNCLRRFAQRTHAIPQENIRVVGTYALRTAKNADQFQLAAQQILKLPVNIINGREEARLIYLGIAHNTTPTQQNRLAIDIGGGSTEFIIGRGYTPMITESLHMGCISFDRFFPEHTIKPTYFKQAVLAAKQELQPITKAYLKAGWTTALGCSGTIRSIENVLLQNGWSQHGITLNGLISLEDAILQYSCFKDIDIAGIKDERKNIFLSGLAILKAIFLEFHIDRLTFTDSALREGLLFDQIDRQQDQDTHNKTIQWIQERYLIDSKQAQQVARTAGTLFNQTQLVQSQWQNPRHACEQVLQQAALLHETGLTVAHRQFHKHGAYLLQNADLPGFSRSEQLRLAMLVRNHRRKLTKDAFATLSPVWQQDCWLLVFMLRLAALVHRSRNLGVISYIEKTTINPSKKQFCITFKQTWLTEHPLTEADLMQEKQYLSDIGWQLKIKTS